MTVRRVDVRGAALVLDISAEAVRKRIARGTLPHERDGEGNVWVLLDGQEDGDRTATGHREDGASGREDLLYEALRDQIALLTRQLDEANRANSEHRRLLAAALERIPELEAPRDERGATETPAETTEGTDPPPDRGQAETGVQRHERSWWRRFFGF